MSVENLNYIDLKDNIEGNERRLDFLKKPLDKSAFFPKEVLLEDIDKSFKEWVETIEIVGDDGRKFPTMSLFSNQRFSEYMQSWSYTDSNNNLLLNFKTVYRENNPKFGDIHGNYYNIPGDMFFLMKQQKVLDNNGTESLLRLKMKQPTSVDLFYKLSIFTTKYQTINEFNMILNRLFNSRQVYISPNGHYMPMLLESINDESQYNIDDRQFYSQTYEIKVMGYIITKDDYRCEEIPLKSNAVINVGGKSKYQSEVEIEEDEENKEIVLTIDFPKNKKPIAEFTIDTDFICNTIKTENLLKNYKIFINGSKVSNETPIKFNEDDIIKITGFKLRDYLDSKMILSGEKF